MNKNPLSGKILLDNPINQMLLEKGIKKSCSLQFCYLSSIPVLCPSIPAGKLSHSETTVGFGTLQDGQTPSAAGVKEECALEEHTKYSRDSPAPASEFLHYCQMTPALIAPQGQTRRSSQFLQRTMAKPATVFSSDFY